ncbi:MAG: glycerol-3-phosphate 1-O-acyltransferase PlsY [Steroidobacterales bacterium]
MLELGIKILIAYLAGSVLGSLVLGKLRGVDIRSLGSGNAGATNALRTQGKLFGLMVLVIDIAKGVLVVRWLPTAVLPLVPADVQLSREWLELACGLAVILGHVYPVWFGFRGGKGAATVVGVVAAIDLRLLAPLLVTWFVVLLLTGYVSLATMLAGVALVATVAVAEPGNLPMIGFCAVLAAFIVFTHRSNITRLRAGNENRVRRLWLLRPRAK